MSITEDTHKFPDELQPFIDADEDSEAHRWYMKGNSNKSTWEGAKFEWCLEEYAFKIIETDEEYVEFRKNLNAETNPEIPEYVQLMMFHAGILNGHQRYQELLEQLKEFA